jgi:phosphate:Na+ symporter
VFLLFEIISSSSVGLGLFLLGLKFFTEGLDRFISKKFKYVLVNLKTHPLPSVLAGCILTGILQSSSATTIILVGLVQADLLTLYQATPIIMGINIGTTVTSQLIAFNIGKYSFVLFFTGVLIILISKNKKKRHIGEALTGFSLVFIGIELLTKGLAPLKDMLVLQQILGQFGNAPLLGILMGFSAISILQSSSTGIAILQTLASTGSISIYSAISIMLGMNVGTCVTAIISSLPFGKSARQTAFMHLFFNIAGLILVFPFVNLLCKVSIYLSPLSLSRQIANAHTIFNVFSTLIFLPFTKVFVNIIQWIIRR